MIKTIIGIILLLMPFLLILKFENKKSGFAYILSFLIAFHLITAVITQFFGIFNYVIILAVNMAAALIVLIWVLAKTNFKKIFIGLKNISLKKIGLSKIDWVLIFVIIVVFLHLYQIHYNYTGKLTTSIQSYKEISGMKYTYPYFSDEWVAVSLVQYCIESGKLPLVNPLWHNGFFINFEFAFHSFISEIIFLLDLNPLNQYVILTIFTGILICLLVYFILRANGISEIVSGIASLSVLYIVNGANLPGIWNLIPFVLGIISLLLGFLFMSFKKIKMPLFLAFLTLIFYPPLFILQSTGLIFYFISLDIPKKEKIKLTLGYLTICLLVFVIVYAFALLFIHSPDSSDSPPVFSYFGNFFGHIFYKTFTTNAIPDFSAWKVIPVFAILLFVFGFIKEARKKIWLSSSLFAGLIYWVFYSHSLWRFMIDEGRVVVFSSILIVIFSGFGLEHLAEYLKKFEFIRKNKIIQISFFIVLTVFFILSFYYTERDNWQELKLHSVLNDDVISPLSPANNYLVEDDLKLFKNIKGKNFLSLPWKGLVIGTATKNYPLHTKESTITNKFADFNEFMLSSCREKYEIAEKNNIDYVYSKEFNCTNFEARGNSKEGFYLYEVMY